jgi:tetratricopeptide (TPR) repeat protein
MRVDFIRQVRLMVLTALFIQIFSCKESKEESNTIPVVEDSVSIFKSQILQDSLNPMLWQKLYFAQLTNGDTTAALRSLHMYTNLAPEDGDAWLTMAWLLADQKDPQVLVVSDSLQKVDDQRIRSTAKYLTGVYYSNLGNYDKAIAIFDSVILNNYTFIDAYMEKGIIQHHRKQFAYALKTFQQAFLIKKNDPEIFLWISKCYAGLGEKEQAEDWKKKYEALK